MPFFNPISDLLRLLFPIECFGCARSLNHGESHICSICLYNLPYTDHHLNPDNLVAKQFWGRLPCHAAMAMLFFKKEGMVQQLLHHLKYSNQVELGISLGILLGERLLCSPYYHHIDYLIPVPLHKKRSATRGYNQCEAIALGISQVLRVPVSNQHLFRRTATASQTKKSRLDRFENMQHAFELKYPEELKNKHLLLIDDVITTGATLEACGHVLLQSAPHKISIATLAFVK